jgi:DNA polymerase-1
MQDSGANQKPSLFLIDGMAIIFRAYYALMSARMQTKDGFPTGAIYGYLAAILKILDVYKPDYMAIAFDSKEKTFRHEKFPDYKANRPEPPEDLILQLQKIHDISSLLGIKTFKMPGYEADDIIGSLTKKFESECSCYLVTPDKDFAQLVHNDVKLLKPTKKSDAFDEFGPEEVKAQFGVYPEHFQDMLALMGDSSDNIPGVPGVGPKTAANLINQYQSIENLYQHLEEQKPRIQKSLKENEKLLKMSSFLVKIKTDLDLDFVLDDMVLKSPELPLLLSELEALEFKTMLSKFKRLASGPGQSLTDESDVDFEFGANSDPEYEFKAKLPQDDGKYHLVTTKAELQSLINDIQKAGKAAFDTETTSLNTLDAELVGISFSFKSKEAYFIHFPQHELEVKQIIGLLKPVFENPEIHWIGQNVKYDILVLKNYGITISSICFDTMLASYVLNPDQTHNLDDLALQWLDLTTVKYADLVGKGKSQKSIYEVEPVTLSDYGCQDADVALQLNEVFKDKLNDESRLKFICEALEFPLINVLADVEREGIKIDVSVLSDMSDSLKNDINSLTKKIYDIAGELFNLDSPKQLAEILFDKLGLPVKRKTKTGYSTDVKVLEELALDYPIAELLLEYRHLQKLKTTYIDALPKLVHPKTGRIHTSFNQHIAATGRLSSSNPNLQNIPIRTQLGKSIRKAFIANNPESKILSADYSQIELRIAAEFSEDPTMLEAFHNGEDIHLKTAQLVFNSKEVSRDMRRKAKEVNFGVLYGIMPFGLAQRLDIPQAEAKSIIDEYKAKYPKIFEYLNRMIQMAKQQGYVETAIGRRRFIKDINSKNFAVRSGAERAAINSPIQGAAADMIKMAMIDIHHEFQEKNFKSKMVLQVHDELVFNADDKEIDQITPIIKSKMIEAAKKVGVKNVPIEVEVGSGQNWLDAH